MKAKIALSFALTTLSFAASSAQPTAYDDMAEVTNVSLNTRDVRRSHRVCEDIQVEPKGDGQNVVGTVLGGVAGGLLGNQVGKGNGRTASTAAGAVIGSVVGNRLSNNSGSSMQTRTQCRNVSEIVTEEHGYLVSYQYHGRSFQTVFQSDPGPSIRVTVHLKPR